MRLRRISGERLIGCPTYVGGNGSPTRPPRNSGNCSVGMTIGVPSCIGGRLLSWCDIEFISLHRKGTWRTSHPRPVPVEGQVSLRHLRNLEANAISAGRTSHKSFTVNVLSSPFPGRREGSRVAFWRRRLIFFHFRRERL